MRILTGRINPLFFFNAPAEGGGAGVAEGETAAEPGALGGAFKTMLSTMKGEEPKVEVPEKDLEEGAQKKAVVAKEPDAAAVAAAAAAEKAKEKPAKKKDPLLEVLKGKTEGEEKKTEPTEAEKADASKRAADIEAATKGLSPKAAENFKAVATARDAAEQRAAALAKELETIKSQKPSLPPDVQTKLARLDELEKEHATVMDAMEKIGAERSPTYQKKFVNGRAALVKKAGDLVKKYGGNEEGFKAALNLTGRERSEAMQEAMGDLHALDQQRVAAILTDLEVLDEEGAAFLQNSKAMLQREELEAQQQEAQQLQEMSRARETAFFNVANQMLHRLPDDHELAAEANPMVDKAIEDAKKFLFEGKDFDSFAKASIAHAMYPVLQQKLFDAATKIAELEAQLEELADAEPGSVGSGGGAGGNAAEQPKGFADRFKGAMTSGASV